MDLISQLQREFPLSNSELTLLMLSAPMRYKVHEIEKRNGRGKRVIAQPTSEVKIIQRWVLANLLVKLPVHEAAIAYRHNLSIKQHAQPHASKKYLLKLDFKDFFPSICSDDFIKHLNRHLKMEEKETQLLSRLLFWKDRRDGALKLSIGAPSSPAISNTILYEFDELVTNLCNELGVTYTRYADDLAFSTSVPNTLEHVHDFVNAICKKISYPRLALNSDKTVFTSQKYRRQLTGLILTNTGNVSIGRQKKREIRAMVHKFSKGELMEEEVPKLRGLLAYAYHIDRSFIDSLVRMIGVERYKSLQ